MKDLLTPKEVARTLQVSRATVYRMVKDREIGHTIIGAGRGRIRIDRDELDRYVRAVRSDATRRREAHRLSADGRVDVHLHVDDGFRGVVTVHVRIRADGTAELLTARAE